MRRDYLVLIMAAYAAAYFTLMRLPGDVLRSPIAGSDLSSYHAAGYLIRTGQAESLYDVAPGDTILGDATSGPYRQAGDRLGVKRQHYYIYPPFFALVVSPLSFLSFAAARAVWLVMELLLVGLFVWIYSAWRRHDGTNMTLMEAGLVAVTLGLEFLPLIWELAIGQTTVLILVLLAGCLLMAKRGSEATAGLLLGLATAIKLTPALLIVYFALRGRKRLAVWGAGCFLAANLAAMAALGLASHAEFFGEVVPRMSGGTAYFLNQSLAGTFNRLLGDGDVRQVYLEDSAIVKILAAATSLILLGITAYVIRSRQAARWTAAAAPHGLSLDLEACALIALSLVISPISWSHHYLLALLPLYTVVAAAGRSGRRSLGWAVAVGVAFLLIARKPHHELYATGPARVALSAAMLGGLTLWAACLAILRWEPAPPEIETQVARAA